MRYRTKLGVKSQSGLRCRRVRGPLTKRRNEVPCGLSVTMPAARLWTKKVESIFRQLSIGRWSHLDFVKRADGNHFLGSLPSLSRSELTRPRPT